MSSQTCYLILSNGRHLAGICSPSLFSSVCTGVGGGEELLGLVTVLTLHCVLSLFCLYPEVI